ncbi:NAD(P)-dependent oxidoreductase [Treponema primitia]|uniref:NAD-dependent epimerase/dehydratase family protein n=1 Tax=Treponema primitia TaxID=88058 RepID=UPI00398076CF
MGKYFEGWVKSMPKTVLLTGATGLIGKEAIQPLLEADFKVFAISSKDDMPKNGNVTWIKVDLLNYDDIKRVFSCIQPKYLLHFAWFTGDGYLSADINYQLLDASLFMLSEFKKNCGKRAVFAGTCFEYQFKDTPLKEDDELNPTTIYARCKNELREKAQIFSNDHDISFGWGRIFYVFGHNEYKNRLLPSIIKALKNNKSILIKSGPLIRDYMYTRDIAEAFVKFLLTDVSGCINICNGQGISIKEFAIKVAEKLKKTELLEFTDNIQNQPSIIIGDNRRLNQEVGYRQCYNIENALENIIKEL